jgi:16S rRNA (cytosine967-C5)-methyltransferase
LLQNALRLLAPNGRLVYSTCSLEPEENELVVSEALGGQGEAFKIVSPLASLERILQPSVPAAGVLSADGFFRTFPAQHDTDGFFAAMIARREM